MSITVFREPGYYGRPHFERQAWPLFGEQKFSNYERFWQAFVPQRINPITLYIKFLPEISSEERRIIKLNYSILRIFYHIYDYKPSTGMLADWHERGKLIFSLNRLETICDKVDWLLFFVLVVTGELGEQHPVRKGYKQRVAERKANIVAVHAPFRGRLLSLNEIPRSIPPLAILPSELKIIKDHYDLHDYLPIAKQIRQYQKSVSSLHSFRTANWLPKYDSLTDPKILARDEEEKHAAVLADEPALQEILGDYLSMPGLIREQADSLITELNKIWGQQVLPLLTQHTDNLQIV